jgi:hypothetical protein
MADTGKQPGGGRPWWESRMDWTLPETLETTLRMSRDLLRNIPQAVSAHKVGKTSPLDDLEPDPIEKMVVEKTTTELHIVEESRTTQRSKAPRVVPPPPPSPAKGVRAINMPPTSSSPARTAATSPDAAEQIDQEVSKCKITLEQLLDPDFDQF